MKPSILNCSRRTFELPALVALLVASGFSTSAAAPKVAKTDATAPVTVVDNGNTWTLDNGIVKATITKRSGFMRSLVYRGIETMGRDGGGIWEETPQLAPQLTETLTIDPSTNGGQRAEIAIKGVTGGTVMLTPGAPGGGTYCDIELRYTLGRGDSGIYTYAIFSHPASYGADGGRRKPVHYVLEQSIRLDFGRCRPQFAGLRPAIGAPASSYTPKSNAS